MLLCRIKRPDLARAVATEDGYAVIAYGLHDSCQLVLDVVQLAFAAGAVERQHRQRPALATGQRFGLNLVSAVSSRGEMRFMIVNGRMNGGRFIEFLDRLTHNQSRPVFLIVDGHPSHRARKVSEYVLRTKGKLRLFFLPAYSPELNPDELVWNHLKNNGIGKRIIRTRDELKRVVLGHLRSLQKTPALIRSFYHQPELRYIIN